MIDRNEKILYIRIVNTYHLNAVQGWLASKKGRGKGAGVTGTDSTTITYYGLQNTRELQNGVY